MRENLNLNLKEWKRKIELNQISSIILKRYVLPILSKRKNFV